ncbi:MAG: DNA-deoxyinosine glycosylase [Sphingomicrobium sp.]
MAEYKTGLGAIARDDAWLIILGSLPGDESLAQNRYYAHPTNQFWRLLGGVIGEDLQSLDYDDRLERLAERGIGLWDVIGSARRSGSLDQAIRDPRHNPLAEFVEQYRALRAVAFNGRTAASVGRKRLAGLGADLALIDLPSSSAAHTRAYPDKARDWAVLANYCRPLAVTPR